jgi:hypothetical protein
MSLTGANLQSHEESREFKDPTAGTLLSRIAGKSSEAHAAIDLVLSSFASVATNTIFSDPNIKITDPLPLAIPSGIRRYGQWQLPANTELRLRYWHMLDPSASIDDLLRRCLMKGLPYRIFLPTEPSSPTYSLFRDHALSVDTAGLLEHGETKIITASLAQRYFGRVHELLRQPDAHKFMECGGLLSRIARHYAPGLLVRAFDGPPLDRRGTELNADSTHYANRIGQAEIQTLMGLTTNSSSLWPHPVLYENSDKYNGEWTAANEIWFLKHANRIQGCMNGTLRSGRDWQKAIRGHTDEQIASPTVIGTVAHASAVCEKLVMEYPEFWDGFDSMPFVL